MRSLEFSENVKRRRKRLGLTLEQLSDKCGVSRSMLSEIERGAKNPTIQVACQIAEALDTTLSYLLGEQQTQTSVVIRREQRLIYHDESSGFERHLLSPSTGITGIEFILNVVPPGKESGLFPPHKPGVKEFIVVAKGQLRVMLGEESCWDLDEGDSMYFEAHLPHRCVNIGEEACEYYLVIDSHSS